MSLPVLAGAWSLDGEPVAPRLSAAQRRALAGGVSGGFDRLEGPLWLCAPRGGSSAGLVEGWDGCPVDGGPRARAEADLARGLLTLSRDASGAERLYFARRGPLLLFCSRAKPLLDALGEPPSLDRESAVERGLTQYVQFGDGTLFAGLREVLAGHRLTARAGRLEQSWRGPALDGPEGDVAVLARELREKLGAAVETAAAGEARIAVALSGGLDSSSIAALAAERLGPDRVRGFTYVFEDASHPSEAPHAAAVCRHLGIAHEEVRLTFEDYMAGLEESVTLCEDPAAWRQPFIPFFARAVARQGFSRILSGFGFGSYLRNVETYCGAFERTEDPGLAPWSGQPPADDDLRGRVEHRLRYTLLCALRGRAAAHFPSELVPLVEAAAASERVRDAVAELEDLSPARKVQRLCFSHLNSGIDLLRNDRLARACGAAWLSPAHFESCLPLAYVTPRGGTAKTLLAAAMADRLPAETAAREKYWPHPIGPRRWREKALDRMRQAAQSSLPALDEAFGGRFEQAARYNPEGALPLAFWHALFIGSAAGSPAPRFAPPPAAGR